MHDEAFQQAATEALVTRMHAENYRREAENPFNTPVHQEEYTKRAPLWQQRAETLEEQLRVSATPAQWSQYQQELAWRMSFV